MKMKIFILIVRLLLVLGAFLVLSLPATLGVMR